MPSPQYYYALISIISLLAVAPLAAQTTQPPAGAGTTDEPITLSAFEVTTSQDVGYQSTNAAEVTRMNTKLENIPMNVTIYNQQFIEDLAATVTTDLLAYESSAVKTSENDGFISRGFTSVSSNFLNGFAQTGGFGSQPLANIERVEVIRGPAAVLYGAGGIGGVYNRITKRPRPGKFFTFRTIAGAEGSFRNEFDFNQPLPVLGGQKVLFRVNGTYDDGKTWFGQMRKETSIAPSLLLNITKDTQLSFEYFFQDQKKQASWETPVHAGNPKGVVTGDGVFREIPRDVAWVSPEDYRATDRHVAAVDLRHAFSANLQFRSQFQYESKIQDIKETFAESAGITILKDAALMPRRWRDLPRDTKNYRTRNELVWEVETGPIKHRILFGHAWDEQYDDNYDYRSPGNYGGLTGAALIGNGVLANNRIGNAFNFFPDLSYSAFLANPTLAGFNVNNMLPLNLVNRSLEPPVPISGRPALFLNNHSYTHSSQQALYVNDVFSFADERFFVMVGTRRQSFKRDTIVYRSGTFPNTIDLTSAPTKTVEDTQSTSSMGAVWHLTRTKSFSLYANANNTFEPQFATQPDGSELDPVTGEQKEFGLRFNLQDGRINGLVTYFDILQDGVLFNDPAPGREGFRIQLKGQRSTGVELSLNARFTDQWYVIGGYSNTDARNDRTGVAQFLQPKHRVTMFNTYRFNQGTLKGLSLSLGTSFTGERPLQTTTTRKQPNWGPLPNYWKVDTTAAYRFKIGEQDYNVSFRVSNVLDEQDIYFVAQNHRFTVDPGREWQLVFGVKF